MSINVQTGMATPAMMNGANGVTSYQARGARHGAGNLQGMLQALATANPELAALLSHGSNSLHGNIPRQSCCEGSDRGSAEGQVVGRDVKPGTTYQAFRRGRVITGTITGKQYNGSFGSPVRLRGGRVLFEGKIYQNRAALNRDMADGKTDGVMANNSEFGVSETADAKTSSVGSDQGWSELGDTLLVGIDADLKLERDKLKDPNSTLTAEQKTDVYRRITDLMMQRTQMTSMISNIMKSLHDANMAIIRNMRA